MPLNRRFPPALWILAPLLALGFLVWLNHSRLERVDYATDVVETEMRLDPSSPTGYAGGLRRLIVPEHNYDSYQWILQTQQMLAQHEWRIRRIVYDNAPHGRTLLTPSPYRWWLGCVAGLDHLLAGDSPGVAVERAARIADPILQAILLLSVFLFACSQFGIVPAGVTSIALASVFPFGSLYLPGQPTDEGLALFCMLWSVLFLLAGVQRNNNQRPLVNEHTLSARVARWFLGSGIAGGIALWVDVTRAVPVLAGVVLGGVIATYGNRRAIKAGTQSFSPPVLPWRYWGISGAATCLVAYLLEYSPDFLGDFQLRHVHPLYGLSWMGAAELLARISQTAGLQKARVNWRGIVAALVATAAVAAAPVALFLTGARDLFTFDPTVTRLTPLVNSPTAQNFWAWILHDGITRVVLATCAPALLLIPAAWLFLRNGTDSTTRARIALGLGPVIVTLGFAVFQLQGWSLLDAMLLVLLVPLASALTESGPGKPPLALGAAGLLLLFIPGALVFAENAKVDRRSGATESDVESFIERDLSHWLAEQAGPGGAVVLAPPNLTTSIIYHGGLSGIGTSYWQNREGTLIAMRIVASSSPDEAQAVARARNVRYIVVPSWDNFLDGYAKLGSTEEQHTLIASLHRWLPPRWLKPIPYHMPTVAGLEGQSVAVFQVVDVQDNATALSNLAEYFVEMDMPPQALGVADTLEHSFRADLGAAVARALVARAAKDATAFSRAMNDVQASLQRGDGDNLTWDRRVSLAIALVEGRRFELAREQMQRCLSEIDEARLRSLTTASLHRFQEMIRGFGLQITDLHLRALAQQLLPREMREQP